MILEYSTNLDNAILFKTLKIILLNVRGHWFLHDNSLLSIQIQIDLRDLRDLDHRS